MKTLATIVLCLFLTILSYSQEEKFYIYKPDSCLKKKVKIHPIPGVGCIVHCKCTTKNQKISLLFQTDASQDSSGIWINKDYEMSGTNLKIRSKGSKFLLVKVLGNNDNYRYTFETSSWSHLRIVRPHSTRPGEYRQ